MSSMLIVLLLAVYAVSNIIILANFLGFIAKEGPPPNGAVDWAGVALACLMLLVAGVPMYLMYRADP